ncbi:SAM-dependent methyltransferase [Aeoliella sp.]|uniref:SAM-dependent methyltransferase n=1 Tax=Aeoliella sp. TaxID=2795800 RepID=UPI003CCB93B4
MNLIDAAERRWLPDSVIRFGIRRLLRKRARQEADKQSVTAFAEMLRKSPLAVHTEAANRQHYEESPRFFEHVLGPRLKYSCCLYPTPESTLAEAEHAMLKLSCERAELADGQRILELGCGWGSLSLWMAQQYPSAEITAISNSHRQREYIQRKAAALGLENLTIETANIVDFAPASRFDRVVSVEMFEHLRNYELLFQRIASWLSDDGKLFAHVFCHRDEPYLFETSGRDDWMGRHFFTGGTMPSEDLFGQFDGHLRIAQQWQVDGLHYWRTCEHWLENLDSNWDRLVNLLTEELSIQEARLALQRWRMFFMACAELFRYENGKRWFVGHYLFEPQPTTTTTTKPASGLVHT